MCPGHTPAPHWLRDLGKATEMLTQRTYQSQVILPAGGFSLKLVCQNLSDGRGPDL